MSREQEIAMPHRGNPYAVGMPYGGSGGVLMAGYPHAPRMTREQGLDSLKSQEEAIGRELEQIEASRISELEAVIARLVPSKARELGETI